MTKIILHHFDISPFAEKIRLVLGLKHLTWQSVQIPIIMPKPDLTVLTGGYRKTPVMQIGADIYCDTNRIALELEHRHPQPTLFPDGSAGLSMALSFWSNQTFFNHGAGLSMGLNTEIPKPILADRKAFFNFMDFDKLPDELPHLFSQLMAHMSLVDDQLADGRPYLLGNELGWIDINAYFVLWMSQNNIPGIEDHLKHLTNITDWDSRIAELGHGQRSELDAKDAIVSAKNTEPPSGSGVDREDVLEFSVGDDVIVEPDDYGMVPVKGELITLNRHEISLRRRHPQTDEVNVHFPRAGYRIIQHD
ncbi:MAG: glutathione S-transferase family protein [Gammaproteobacteria bacterium]|nr:glutathione S-transferase family protein [Gammaproteobacteria bacterium]